MYTIAALYKFVSIDNPLDTQHQLRALCQEHLVRGTLIIAHEGINGTIAGSEENITSFLNVLQSDKKFSDMELKFSSASKRPFTRMKVHLKKEIVTLGVEGVSPVNNRGTYVDVDQWNELISDPDVMVVDTRNDYEVNIGTFKGAIDPNIKTFREFPDFVKTNLDQNKHKKVAMFCTGGIRCEKSTALLNDAGFESVFHLKGGILKYLEHMDEKDSLWEGECFVFDERTAVSHGLKESDYTFCRGCRNPISPKDTEHQHYLENIHCHQCYPKLTDKKRRSSLERQHQINLQKMKAEKFATQANAAS